MENRHIPA